MKFIFNVKDFKKKYYGCVLTIGNFDGVHCGHQLLLKYLCYESKKRKLPSMVMLFEPQPLEFFSSKAPARLTLLREKLCYLKKIGIDIVYCVKFNNFFACTTPQIFIDKFLVKKLGVQLLAVGKDFRFGSGRTGNLLLLKQAGKKYGFDVICTKIFYKNGVRISSTLIRKIILKGNFSLAKDLLGHPFFLSGRIIHGDALGRKIGIPTANICLRRRLVSPVHGVYAVNVYGLSKKPLNGIANVGTRPTINGTHLRCEVHLFNLEKKIYGHYIKVVFHKKIRKEKKFASIKKLKKQIIKDIKTTKKIFELKYKS